jgi:eukaryotic-like serine/threonine-protein kinase
MSQDDDTLLDMRGPNITAPTAVIDVSKRTDLGFQPQDPAVRDSDEDPPAVDAEDDSLASHEEPELVVAPARTRSSDFDANRRTDSILVDPLALAPTDPDLQDRRFEIITLLGEGSMAKVYLAKDRFLSTEKRQVYVAIKVFDNEHPHGTQTLQRIQIELLAALHINSKHVCRAHTVIELADGRRAIVMELIRGRTLSSIMVEGMELDYLQFALWGIEIANGLHAAHLLDIVHRDLKPENVMLRDEDGTAVILDLGVAKFYLEDFALTHHGNALGTPMYMAPEQFGGPVDPRTDLYALGLILARLATGKVPHADDGQDEMYRQRVMEPKPYRLKDHAPNAPTEYAMIVDRLLSHLPQDRFQTGAHVAEALNAFIRNSEAKTTPPRSRDDTVLARARKTAPLRQLPLPPPPPPARKNRRLGWLLAVLVVIAIGAIGSLAYGAWSSGRLKDALAQKLD